MKKVVLFFLILLILPFVSSLEISSQPQYKSEETMIVKISGNFLTPLQIDNVNFYRAHVKVPLEKGLAKINEEYYIYALLPEVTETKNYSLKISGSEYYQGTQIIDEDIEVNFTINSLRADFNVNPGVVVENRDFSIRTQNLINNQITISISNPTEISSESQLILKSGEIKNIQFTLNDIQKNSSSPSKIVLSSSGTFYEIPVSIFSTSSQRDNNLTSMRFSPIEINASFVKNSEKTKTIQLTNNGEKTITDIELSLSENLIPFVSLSRYEISELEINQTANIQLFILSDKAQYLEGAINAESKDFSTFLEISLDVVKDFNSLPIPIPNSVIDTTKTLEDYDSSKNSQTCLDLNGTFCESGEVCENNDSTNIFGGGCCLSLCISEDNGSSSRFKVIGWTLLALVIVILIWFFLKYRGTKK